MKKVRVLMFFILCFLLTIGGNVYAESVEKDTQKESSTVVESVSSDTNVEKETIQANDNNSDKEAIEPNQENFETESVEVEESNQEEELSAGDLEDSKEIEPEKEKVDENQVISNQENLNQEESEKESSSKDNFLEEDQKSGKIREGLEKEEEDSQVLDSEASQEKTEESSQLDLEKSSQEEKLDQDNTLDQVGVELEEGTIIDPANLNPLGAGSTENEDGSINVDDFASLKKAIESTKSGEKKTIIVTGNIEITGTIEIPEGADIVLTSSNKKAADGKWNPIEQPKDYADEGEKKQREIIEEARRRGKEAEEKAEININKTGAASYSKYEYIFEDKEIVLKRFNNFTGTMFNVLGKLTLGDNDSSINFDGNKKNVVSNVKGSFFDVSEGGELILNNGIIANGKNSVGYNGSIYLQNGAKFTMNGGRISSNEVEWTPSDIPFTTGGVYAARGSEFIMNNGMIDHNMGTSAAIFVGDFSTAKKENLFEHPESAGIVKMNGGYIIGNQTNGSKQFSGAVTVFSGGTFDLKDGIIADNSNYGDPNSGAGSGAVYISDGFISDNSNTIRGEWSETYSDYEKYVSENKAEANFNGGLIYDNYAFWSGGGLFIDSEYVGLNRIMILDNRASRWGGGIYYSFPPRLNKLEHMLVTENKVSASAVSTQDEYWGGPSAGGGLWNCPTGYVHIGDGHSLYIYNNKASQKGTDISFAKKAYQFLLNGEDIHDEFYSHVSPITEKGNIIKFFNDDIEGKQSIPYDMSYTDQTMYLRAVYSDVLIKEAWSNSNAFIIGNSSSYGGGIGSNANLTTGDKGNVDFTFKKNWHKDIDEEEYEYNNLHIDIFIVPENVDEVYVRSQYGYDNNLFKYGEVVLNRHNNWQARFSEWNNGMPAVEDHGLPFTNEDLAKRGLKYLIIERETGYATNVEQKEKGSSIQYGKVTITKEKSVDLPDFDTRDYGADFYFYELHPDGTATYIGKSKRLGDNKSINSEFVHPILNNKLTGAEYYGINGEKTRYLIEKGTENWIDDRYQGYPENVSRYAIFIEKADGGIKFYVPYIWIQKWDREDLGHYSGLALDHKEKGGPLVVEPYGYEFTINNSPFTEAKIKKTWQMLTEEEIRKALGEYGKDAEVKNREIPDSVTFYVLKDGKRIATDYKRDEYGKVHAIYKTVTLTKKGGWEGVIKELDPILLAKGAYGIEEEVLEGFKSSYKLQRVLMNPEDFKEKNKKTLSKIQFKLDLLTGYEDEDGNYYTPSPLEGFMGDITVNLIVDGKLVETKVIKYNYEEHKWSDGYGVPFGYDKDKQIIVDGKNHPIEVKYYNLINNDIGYRNLSLDLYLKKDKNEVYSLYVPNVLGQGSFIRIFDIVDEDDNLITDFNPIKKVDPIYEYIFEVINEEIPPEPPKPEEPPEEPPHEPPEIPDTPPTGPGKHPKEEEINPEEKPVVPIVEVEETPVVSPKKAGGAPQTGVESVGSYVLIAISSGLGLGYIRRKKH